MAHLPTLVCVARGEWLTPRGGPRHLLRSRIRCGVLQPPLSEQCSGFLQQLIDRLRGAACAIAALTSRHAYRCRRYARICASRSIGAPAPLSAHPAQHESSRLAFKGETAAQAFAPISARPDSADHRNWKTVSREGRPGALLLRTSPGGRCRSLAAGIVLPTPPPFGRAHRSPQAS